MTKIKTNICSLFLISCTLMMLVAPAIIKVSASGDILIEIKVSKIRLAQEGDGQGMKNGEIYMDTPDNDWPDSEDVSLYGGIERRDFPLMDTVKIHDVESVYEEVYYVTTVSNFFSYHEYNYELWDDDGFFGVDDKICDVKIQIGAETNGWVGAWSKYQAGYSYFDNFNRIYTYSSASEVYSTTNFDYCGDISNPSGGDLYDIFNSLYFEIRVQWL